MSINDKLLYASRICEQNPIAYHVENEADLIGAMKLLASWNVKVSIKPISIGKLSYGDFPDNYISILKVHKDSPVKPECLEVVHMDFWIVKDYSDVKILTPESFASEYLLSNQIIG